MIMKADFRSHVDGLAKPALISSCLIYKLRSPPALCLPGIPPAECANARELLGNFNLDINKYKLKATGHRESGFALIELVSVVVIIGILAAMGIVGFWGFLGKSKKNILHA